jgi:hypothetical protein
MKIMKMTVEMEMFDLFLQFSRLRNSGAADKQNSCQLVFDL